MRTTRTIDAELFARQLDGRGCGFVDLSLLGKCADCRILKHSLFDSFQRNWHMG